MQTKYILTTLLLVLSSATNVLSASYIWTGTSSTNWNTSGNWSSGIIPGVADFITLNSNAPNNLVLDQNRTVANFTINGDTVDLGTYTLTTTGVTYFNGGLVSNGNLNISGSLCHFGGATINARIEASCGYYHMNGGVFLKPVDLVCSGTSNTTGTGSNIFEDSLTITHSGVFYFTMGSSTNDFFNGPVSMTNHASKEVYLANGDTSFYNANVTISSTGNGGVAFGNGGGVSVLASGKTITIGSSGFAADYLTLKNFIQNGTTAQTLTLTGTAIVNMINSTFHGNLTVTAPGFLLKNSTFNGTATLTRTGSSGNHQSDGGNVFNNTVTLDNAGTSGRIRWATTTADTFNGNATFNSTTGQDVQVCYTGNNYFYKNVTINSNKVVFNTSTGKVTLAGDTAQSLNGSYNYAFKKLAINKNANHVTANTTLSVDDTLFFVSGNLLTTATNLLTMKAGSKVSGASSNSFVSGPVKKIGNTAFAYPVGRNASYRPIEISAPSTTTSEFTGEYVEDSVSVNTSSRESTLGYLNRNNYWKLNRQVGTSQVYVTLSWDTPNALVDTFVKVASWNGTQWKDLGKGIVSGNRIIGSVQSTNAAQSYLEFSLSYWNINAIPGAPNCSDVQNESDLRYCLTFTTSGSVQVTTNIFVNSFDVDGLNQLPFPIQVDVTLEGKNGLTSPKWWEQYCPIISTNHKSEFTNLTNDNKKSIFLFAMQPGAVVQNLRIRGASCNFQDYNQGDLLCGGIFIENEVGSTIIRNCEIACFSYAGVWKRNLPETLTIENCYIHKVKGECQFGIGYGIWTQGPFNLPAQKMNFTNILFDDCKAAIDGQGYVVDWTINKCSFSQFFHSEEINLHNRNDFRMWDDDDNYDYFYCYQNPNNTCTTSPAFYGYKNNSTAACTTITTPANTPGYTFGWLNFPDIPMYDVGGATTIVSNSIFNKKRTLDSEENGNSHMNLTFPNRDVSKGGFATNGFQILNNTFATKQYSLVELLAVNNLGGYAKIADNAIDACVWEGDAYIVKSGNAFEYQPGVPLSSSTAPIPCELVIELNDGTAPLPTTTTLSPYSNTRFIQHVELNTDFNIAITPGTLGSQILNSIIRPNPNKDPFTTPVNANVISDDNYFYDGEIFTDQTSTIITGYDKPGLYGIDVLAFDAVPNNNIYDFKASPWSHIPIIVNGAVDKTLYFNIKDSYLQDNGPTGVKKQAYFNDLLIWQEDIADGGTGWEYVQVDLTGNGLDASATPILSTIKTDGNKNILEFSIFIEAGISTNDVAGVLVFVDDVYIPKTGSATGDNLIKDGSCELQTEALCEQCYWMPRVQTVIVGTVVSTSISTSISINDVSRKSGSRALYLKVPYCEDCTTTTYTNSAKVVASIGTNIDFTDLLSCNDYVVDVELDQSDIDNASTILTYSDQVIHINSDLEITGKTLEFIGCLVVVESDASSPVAINIQSTGNLIVKPLGAKPTHFFGCNDMWQGIKNNNGNVTINTAGGATIFEDAIEAIESTAGDVNIRYAKFKENHIGLQFINYNQSPDNNATELGLLGIEFSCPDNVLSRAPFEGEQSLANIDLVDVVNVSIGGFGATPATPTTYQNKFADAIYGIRSQSSTAKIFNNEFTNIGIKEVICRLCEGAIFATDGSNLTIGGLLSGQNSNPFFRNYFKNSNVGIITRGVNTIDVKGNHFDKIGKGFIAHNASSSPITINENNEFYNVDNGIIAREITGIVTIEGNLFNPASLSTTDEFHYSSTAVTLQNYNDYATTTTNVIVSGNIIQDCRIGVHALNIPNISIGADVNGGIGNTITFTSEKGSYHCGIWIENCTSANIQGNEITKLSGGFSLEGITVTESADALINMNTITSADVPIHVFGNCSDTEFHCNYIDNQTEPGVGVVLDNAQLPDQGIKPSLAPPNGETWDNEWHGYTGSNYGVTGLSNQQFKWYFDDSQIHFDPNPDPTTISADALTSPDHFGCATLIANDDPDRDVRYGALVLDTLTFEDYLSEFIYKGKEQLYALIKSDTSILIRNTANDSVFTRFYNETMITNIALFDRVDSLILAGSLDPASDLNSSITDTNLIETNRKTVNDILINKVLMDVDLSATDSTTLEEIALQNPITGGKAVYQARAILFLEVHYFNEALRLAHQLNETTNTVKTNLLASFELIPNPANENCMVKFNEFNQKFVLQVRQATGQLVFSAELLPHTQSKLLDTSTMDPGVYFVFVNDGKAISEIKKLVVVR